MLGDGDLDYGLLVRMTTARNIYNALRAVRSASGEAIHSIPEAQWRLFEWLVEQGFTQ